MISGARIIPPFHSADVSVVLDFTAYRSMSCDDLLGTIGGGKLVSLAFVRITLDSGENRDKYVNSILQILRKLFILYSSSECFIFVSDNKRIGIY